MRARRHPSIAVALLLAAAIPQRGAAAEQAEGPGPAYLGYAGPHSSSPSSAFGHLFLVLAADARDPAPLWTVVTFNAVTLDVGPVRYLTIGIAGGFLGRFDRFPFHQKTREYQLLDDRDLWLLELRLSREERAALEEALGRTAGRWYPYSFFRLNCAHYLQAVLAEATGAVPPPSGVVSPIEVFERAQGSRLAGPAFHRPAASRRIAVLAGQAEPAFVDRLRRSDWRALAADLEWIAGLTSAERGLVQELFALRALQTTSLLPAATSEGLARLRLLAAQPRAGAPDPGAVSGAGVPIAQPAFHRYPRLGLLYSAPRGGTGRVHLKLRAAMHDETEPAAGQQPGSTMELLGVEVSSPVDRPRARLEAAVLFSQRALAPSDWTRERVSWLLEVQARRGGLFGAAPLHGEARAGFGKTLGLPAGTDLHAVVTVAATGALGEGAALAPGVELGLVSRPAARWRGGAAWTREHDVLEWSRSVERARLWTRVDGGRRWGAILAWELGPGSRSVRLGVDLYL
jgi:hypothetical protein